MTLAHVWEETEQDWKEGPSNAHRLDDNFRTADALYTSFAGGVALVVKIRNIGEYCVGGLGVSGRKQLEDHEIALTAYGAVDLVATTP